MVRAVVQRMVRAAVQCMVRIARRSSVQGAGQGAVRVLQPQPAQKGSGGSGQDEHYRRRAGGQIKYIAEDEQPYPLELSWYHIIPGYCCCQKQQEFH